VVGDAIPQPLSQLTFVLEDGTWQNEASSGLAVDTVVDQVACAPSDPTQCAGVGDSVKNPLDSLVAQWDGSVWVEQPNPATDDNVELAGVACPSIDECVAVGATSAPAPFAELWSGGGWVVSGMSAPPGGSGGYLYGVSCPTASACVAVGVMPGSPGVAGGVFAERAGGL
jgi:hypothetical protein